MSLWVGFTIFAAAMQTLRFMLQKQLKGLGLSTGGATFSRFLFAAPIAVAMAAGTLWVLDAATPALTLRFWAFVLMGGVAQIIATFLTVALFSLRNFAVGVAFTKTETVQVALFSAVLLAEVVSPAGWLAIAVGFCGVVLMSRGAEIGAELFGRPTVYGLLAGGLFGISAIGYRGATLALEPAPFFLRTVMALAAATVMQSLIMVVWLCWREPGEVGRVLAKWRRTILVGLTGAAGSLGWFAAFSLQHAAYVRALGQVEMVFMVLVSTLVFRERLSGREATGIALIVASVIMIVLSFG
ncbi:MAG: DMT family transporter [Rhodobacteraceae bacterium]|nr:DMT family transporter [Paracoccaceae bacterium]